MNSSKEYDTDSFLRSNRVPTAVQGEVIKSLLVAEEATRLHLIDLMEQSRTVYDNAKETTALHNACIVTGKVSEGRSPPDTREEPTQREDQRAILTHHNEEQGTILRSRDKIISRMHADLENAEDMVLRQTEAVSIASEELQGALSVERFSQAVYGAHTAQLEQLVLSMESKRSLFRPIWRVPMEIWNYIFRETLPKFQPPTTDEAQHRYDQQFLTKHRRQPFLLSAVCHRWRIICRADPQMWRHPTVFIAAHGKIQVVELETYCSLSGRKFESITLLTNRGIEDGDFNIHQVQLSDIKSLNTLNVVVCGSTTEFVPTSEWWWALPPIRELVVTSFDSFPYILQCTLPQEFRTSIRKVSIKKVDLDFGPSLPYLEELSIDIARDWPYLAIIPLLRQSGQNLRKLHVVADLTPEENLIPVSLNKLEEVSMSLNNLVSYLGTHFILPSLRKVDITVVESLEIMDWETFFQHGDHINTVEEISIGPDDSERVLKIAPLLSRLKKLRKLQLYGENVTHILKARLDAIKANGDGGADDSFSSLDNVEQFDLVGYFGNGDVVLEFVTEMMQGKAGGTDLTTQRGQLRIMTFDVCWDIPRTVLDSLRVLLGPGFVYYKLRLIDNLL